MPRRTQDTPQPITTRTLDKAVEQGILTRLQVAELHELAGLSPREAAPASAGETDGAYPRDPENLRFIGGFGDVFVTIGILLFLSAIAQMVGGVADGGLGGVTVAFGSWVLAEYFTRVRRMALPSIVLLIGFVGGVFGAILQSPGLVPDRVLAEWGVLGWVQSLSWDEGGVLFLIAGVLAAIAASIHYWRFRVPITVAAGAGSLAVALFVALRLAAPQLVDDHPALVLAVFGAALFVLAMRFDLRDPERVTRNTDIAFWLHLLAAPLIVRAVLPAAGGEGFSTDWIFTAPDTLSTGSAVLVLVLFLALGAVSILIDRRALLVAGLSFAGVAYWSVLRAADLTADNGVVITLASLGAFILLVSIGWKPLRRLLLLGVPAALTRRLPVIQ